MPDILQRKSPVYTAWLSKFIASFFAIVAVINIVLMVSNTLPEKWQQQLNRIFYNNMLAIHVWPSLLLAFFFSFYWQYRERKNIAHFSRIPALLYGITRYWLAFEISAYGFAKLFQTQFAQSFQRNDMLAGNMNGFNLTWHYFSYSFPLTVIIGLLQIGGSMLLLTRRTTLLGVFILLPVLFNILLINIFYHIASGAFMNSVLFTLGLLYLLLLRWQDLKKIFFYTKEQVPTINLGKLALFKLLPVLAAFWLIYSYVSKNKPTGIAGKWKVDLMIKDRDTVKQDAWLNDGRVWSNIYLEEYGQVAISANPYLFDNTKSQYGTYHYDGAKKNIQIMLFAEHDTANLKVIGYKSEKMEWRGIVENDTVVIFLSRSANTKERENW